MNNILQTQTFKKWLGKLKDVKGKALIFERVESARQGNFGDCKSLVDNVSEMRIHFGPGYRIYFTLKDGVIYILLCGGTKGGQKRDIEKAKKMAKQILYKREGT